MIALDTPNPDPTDLAGSGPARLPVHGLVADAGGIVVENLTALEKIDFADPWLSVLPLRIAGRTVRHVEPSLSRFWAERELSRSDSCLP